MEPWQQEILVLGGKQIVAMDMVAGFVSMKKTYLILSAFVILFFVIVTNKNFKNVVSQNAENPKIVLEQLAKNKRGIYVFGFEDCPWCKELYPLLSETLIDSNEYSYYVDTHKDNFKELERENLKNHIVENTKFDDVVVPLVVMISDDGFYQYHVGTVEGHDATKEYLNSSQKEELSKNLSRMIYEYKKHNN